MTETFPRVLFAGTFDHLHDGHKAVIAYASSICTEELIIGITSDGMLSKKKYHSALQPYNVRERIVRQFAERVSNRATQSIKVKIVETSDPVGPARDLEFDALVVTEETVNGGELVNEARMTAGKPVVTIIVADILDHKSVSEKLSSTTVREGICDQLPTGEAGLDFLNVRWTKLTEALNIQPTKSREWWSNLRDMYGCDPNRFYHNIEHVYDLLCMKQQEAPSPGFELAIWFHDCVYNPRSSSNEDDSVEMFGAFALEAGLATNVVVSVKEAIGMTKHHFHSLSEGTVYAQEWIPIFLESDMSILATDPVRYDRYRRDIRSEYSHVPDSEFKKRRSEILGSWKENFRFRFLPDCKLLNERLLENIENELRLLS
jgi:cytidyltransferase-like protein